VFLGGIEEMWVIDVETERITHVDTPLHAGDPPFPLIRRGSRLVGWGYSTYVFDPADPGSPRTLADDSWIYIPSAIDDRVWVGVLDESSPDTVRVLSAVREMDLEGRVTFPDVPPPHGRWPVAATTGGLVFQDEMAAMFIWDPETRRVVHRFGPASPVAWQGDRLAWCPIPCEAVRVTNTRTWAEVLITAPPGTTGFVGGLGEFSPGGRFLAVPIQRDGFAGPGIVDLATGETRVVLEDGGPGLFGGWSLAGEYFFTQGQPQNAEQAHDGTAEGTLLGYDPVTRSLRRIPIDAGNIYFLAAV
jgi:hypothetical protein